jgi:hypothetical protein
MGRFSSPSRDLGRPATRRRVLIGMGMTTLGAMLGMGTSGVAFAQPGAEVFCGTNSGHVEWDQPMWGLVITELTIRIDVGGDDVRSQSSVHAYVNIRNKAGDKWFSVEMNPFSSEYPNGSMMQQKISLEGAGLGLITVENIHSFFIDYTSGLPDMFSSSDNWNMNAIRVLYPKSDSLHPPFRDSVDWSQYNQLFSGSGSPWLHRFKNSCDGEGGPSWQGFNPNWNPI